MLDTRFWVSGLSDADANGLIGRLKPNAPSRRSVQESASLGRRLAGDLSGCTNSELARLLDPLATASVLGASLAVGRRSRMQAGRVLAESQRAQAPLDGRRSDQDGRTQGTGGRTYARCPEECLAGWRCHLSGSRAGLGSKAHRPRLGGRELAERDSRTQSGFRHAGRVENLVQVIG